METEQCLLKKQAIMVLILFYVIKIVYGLNRHFFLNNNLKDFMQGEPITLVSPLIF